MFCKESKEFLEITHMSSRKNRMVHGRGVKYMESHYLPMQGTHAKERAFERLSLKTTVSPKMQITIPAKLARLFAIQPGDTLQFTTLETTARVHRIVVEQLRQGKRLHTFRIATKTLR